MSDNYKFFEHRECEFYPCHPLDEINCLWCYCPLQTKKDCPGILSGKAKYLLNGYKDCSKCDFPHKRENYSAMLREIDILINRNK